MKRSPLMIAGDFALCQRCDQKKPLDEFRRVFTSAVAEHRPRSSYRRHWCIECETRRVRGYIEASPARLLRHKFSMSMSQAKRLGNIVTIVPDDAQNLWNQQQGLCFYTNIPMVVQSGNGACPESLSFDKIEPPKGYVLGNVVLCTRKANAVKQNLTLEEIQMWLPGWYKKIVDFKELFG